MEDRKFLEGVSAFVLEQGLGKARRQILAKQLETHGGGVASNLVEGGVTHVVVGGSVKYSRLTQLLKVDTIPENIHVVYADWLSACLVGGQRLDPTPYLLRPEQKLSGEKRKSGQPDKLDCEESKRGKVSVEETKLEGTSSSIQGVTSDSQFVPINKSPSKRPVIWAAAEADSDSDYVESADEDEREKEEGFKVPNREKLAEEGLIKPLPKKGKWLCQIPSTQQNERVNHNEALTNKLEELLGTYNSSSLPKDQWRAMSLKKALAAIKKYPKEITSYEEARAIPFVGDRLADKIHEIITSGHLRRLDMVDKEKETTIDLFLGIHGVGKTTAEEFYAKGFRNLADLQSAGVLNRIQQIGLKYYQEFKERMPRSEVEQIEERVKRACHSINTGILVVTCGSYRRGKQTCGDVDILVTHPDGRSHKGVFGRLIQKLKEEGFLTDDLTVHDDQGEGSGCKYLGVCKLEGEGRKHRRIDIYTCPYSEYPLMLLHFTGSGHFNRSMRNKADKMGMSLSEHSLNAGVIRKNGVKVFEGTPLPVFSEEDVFKYLDIPYLEPIDRDLA